MSTNLELKIRCDEADLDKIEDRARRAGAGQIAEMRQVDTYFAVAQGRLKLREITPGRGVPLAELIGYQRPDEAGARWSRYTRAEVPLDAVDGIRAALAIAPGILVVVDKVRRVGIWRRTRIHLDRVAGLGAFVELETVTDEIDDPSASAELAEIAGLLGLDAYPVIAGSYSDLLLEANNG